MLRHGQDRPKHSTWHGTPLPATESEMQLLYTRTPTPTYLQCTRSHSQLLACASVHVCPARVKFILLLRVYILTFLSIRFILKSIQTHISMQKYFKICVCTFLKANSIGEKVRACALKGKKNRLHPASTILCFSNRL